MYKKKIKSGENRKVRNAKKIEIDGIIFDSQLEGYCYTLLKDNNIKFELKKVIESVPGFKHMGKSYLPVKSIPDFYLGDMNIIIETKGFANDVYPIKKKLLLKYFADKGIPMQIFVPTNRKEVLELVQSIKDGKPFLTKKVKKKKNDIGE